MGPGAFSACGVSKTMLRNAAEAIRRSRSTDGLISRGGALRCANELTAIFLRGANDARNRGKTAGATAGAFSRSHGSANHVDRRIGTIYAILDGITTVQARATDGGASETVANMLAPRRDGCIARPNWGDHDRVRDRARRHRDDRDCDRARKRENASETVANALATRRDRCVARSNRGKRDRDRDRNR